MTTTSIKPTTTTTKDKVENDIINNEIIDFVDEFTDCPKFELQIGELTLVHNEARSQLENSLLLI